MFKTTLAATMIMALAVTAGCGGSGDKKSALTTKKVTRSSSQFANGTSAKRGMTLAKSLLKNPTALLH